MGPLVDWFCTGHGATRYVDSACKANPSNSADVIKSGHEQAAQAVAAEPQP